VYNIPSDILDIAAGSNADAVSNPKLLALPRYKGRQRRERGKQILALWMRVLFP